MRPQTTRARYYGRMQQLVFLVIAAGTVGGEVWAGLVFDAVVDFSKTVNTDTSTWSYRRQAGVTRDGAYDLLPNFVVNPAAWNPDVGHWFVSNSSTGFNPGVGVNDTGGPVTFTLNTSTFSWPADAIWMHPNANELIVVSWLSSDASFIDIEFSFADMDPNGSDGGVAWFVDLGSASGQLASGVFGNGGSSGPQSIFGVPVSAGDRVNFIVAPPTTNHFFDSTTFTATVSAEPIPEPSTLTLGILAAAALVGSGYCRRTRKVSTLARESA